MHLKRFYYVLLSVLLALVLSPVLPNRSSAVSAAETAQQCDATPKYWCTKVNYTRTSTVKTVNYRSWRGGRDGGAYKWRLDYAIDYRWNGSSYVTGYSGTGPSAYQTNIPLAAYTCGSCVTQSYTTSSVLVQMLLKYWEDIGQGPYSWFSPVMNHYVT